MHEAAGCGLRDLKQVGFAKRQHGDQLRPRLQRQLDEALALVQDLTGQRAVWESVGKSVTWSDGRLQNRGRFVWLDIDAM